ncbi:MAG: PAS domain S-box protein, partial [Candidatus Marinimicrobia bacterium]|nr:PAS domain S-box protein [Candidatus Neomarinimicrobiota bacterium]
SGYTNIEFIEKRHLLTEIVHPDYVGIMKDHYLSESQNKNETTTLDLIIVTKNGKEKWVEHTCSPIFEKDGTFLGRRGTNRDITRRKKYETDLKKFNVLIDQSPFSIVITDLEGNIDYVNPYFEKITGYSYKESIGQPTNILKSGKTNPEVYTDLWHTIIKGNIWKGEFHNKTKDGELFWESASISPIMNQDGQTFQYMAIKEDITDKKLLESQLHQSQKMEAIGQFAGGIAHDFNNILTAILGFTEIGLMDNKEDEILNNVKISSLRAASLVKKLLGFSRKQIIEPLVLDVKHLIDDLEKMLNRMLGENIQIIKVYKGNIPLIFADPGQIEQIIINLIVNARDAVNSDNNLNEIKSITVDLNKTIIQKSLTENNFTIPPGSYITISVSDTGCGMDKKTQKRIFEPFFTTKEEGKGTGLGLATVYGIIKQNKGYITVTSEPWVGTTFKIYWPIFKTPKIIPGSNISEDNAIKGNETIVLVEDDKNIITMVENGLTKLGYTVISYNNPLIALEEIPKLEESFDILISDVIMPNMNGKELTDKLSKIKPELKILYTSGYTDDHIVNAGILKKDVNFLAKPYNLTELTKKIKLIIK